VVLVECMIMICCLCEDFDFDCKSVRNQWENVSMMSVVFITQIKSGIYTNNCILDCQWIIQMKN